MDHHNRIAVKAYYLWEQAGKPEGRSDEFWQKAKQEILLLRQARFGRLTIPLVRRLYPISLTDEFEKQKPISNWKKEGF